MTDFLQKVISDRGCDCGDLSSCLVRSIHFMPCHQLLLVQVPERIDFYSVSEVLQGTENITKYSTEVKESRFSNVWIDNNTHTAVRYLSFKNGLLMMYDKRLPFTYILYFSYFYVVCTRSSL